MAPDEVDERAIQALLDGRALPGPSNDAPGSTPSDAVRVIDAIARVHRHAILGSDVVLDRPDRTRWGHLEIRNEIGRGASATVYRAWDTRLAREVALKLFAPDVDQGDAALDEGRLLARLNHPHIVTVFGTDSRDGCAGIWMELLEGDTLDGILARDGVFGAEETLLIGRDLARALSAVHAAGLLHRDIKSRNVLRERGGRIVLMDLGAGRTADNPHKSGDATGTPMYMAPEVIAGGAATVQSDLYCLGVLLYRLLAGAFPVGARDLAGLRAAHASGERQALNAFRPDLPAAIAGTIERCCHPNPDARYENAVELETALTEALTTTLGRTTSVASPLSRQWRRWRQPISIATAMVAVTVLTTLSVWDTNTIRGARRRLGMVVPPRSTLYLSMNAGMGVVRGGNLSVHPNPTTASRIAVSSDLAVLTMPGIPPWTTGGHFQLDGTPAASMPIVNEDLCCFTDGATDGEFNYSARQDSTLLEPAGSRPLAPPVLYRFDRDWSNPRLLFALRSEGGYMGVAYSANSQSFWLTRKSGSSTVIEEWSRDGKLLATPVVMPAVLMGLAVDPLDDTLWVVRQQLNAVNVRLENFDRAGRHLAAIELPKPFSALDALGAEFEWTERRR